MLTVSRRSVLTGLAGAIASVPRRGCRANGWDLDPKRFDLLLTALKEMRELGFQAGQKNKDFTKGDGQAIAT